MEDIKEDSDSLNMLYRMLSKKFEGQGTQLNECILVADGEVLCRSTACSKHVLSSAEKRWPQQGKCLQEACLHSQDKKKINLKLCFDQYMFD